MSLLKRTVNKLAERNTAPLLTELVSNSVPVPANDAKTATWTIPTHTGYTPIIAVCENTQSTGIVCTVSNIISANSIYCSFRNVTGTSVTVKPEVTVIYIKTVLL